MIIGISKMVVGIRYSLDVDSNLKIIKKRKEIGNEN